MSLIEGVNLYLSAQRDLTTSWPWLVKLLISLGPVGGCSLTDLYLHLPVGMPASFAIISWQRSGFTYSRQG